MATGYEDGSIAPFKQALAGLVAMISRVLVPMDDSRMSERALEHACEAYPDAEITVLHVVGEPSPMMGEAACIAIEGGTKQVVERHAEGVLTRAEEIANEHAVDITTEIRLGSPSRGIIQCAEGFDTVVIGSHSSRLISRLLIGNVADTVVRRSSVPVTVVR